MRQEHERGLELLEGEAAVPVEVHALERGAKLLVGDLEARAFDRAPQFLGVDLPVPVRVDVAEDLPDVGAASVAEGVELRRGYPPVLIRVELAEHGPELVIGYRDTSAAQTLLHLLLGPKRDADEETKASSVGCKGHSGKVTGEESAGEESARASRPRGEGKVRGRVGEAHLVAQGSVPIAVQVSKEPEPGVHGASGRRAARGSGGGKSFLHVPESKN